MQCLSIFFSFVRPCFLLYLLCLLHLLVTFSAVIIMFHLVAWVTVPTAWAFINFLARLPLVPVGLTLYKKSSSAFLAALFCLLLFLRATCSDEWRRGLIIWQTCGSDEQRSLIVKPAKQTKNETNLFTGLRFTVAALVITFVRSLVILLPFFSALVAPVKSAWKLGTTKKEQIANDLGVAFDGEEKIIRQV